jgi:tetratricopeptide (TPR) repeat protein
LPDKSLKILKLLEASPKNSDRIDTAFHQAEILIDLGEFDQARNHFLKAKDIPKNLIPTAKFLDATLTLIEGNAAAAETIFTDLINKPDDQSTTRYNLAAIGKADAIAAQNKQPIATQFLLTFIKEHPQTTSLDPMFRRIIDWLPGQIITYDHPTLVQLDEWIPKILPPSSGLINTEPASAAAVLPTEPSKIDDLAVFAMHSRAIGLHRINNPKAKIEARLLMQRILLLAPHHFLAPKSLFELAKWHLEADESQQAFALLDSLRQTTHSSLIKGEATFLDAKLSHSSMKLQIFFPKKIATALYSTQHWFA